MDQGDERFDHIARRLLPDGAEPGKMFGARALMFEGKAFACLKRGMFAGKLGAGSDEHAQMLTVDGAELFDPSGGGRPFRDWVALPVAQSDAWPRLARAALDVARGQHG